LNLSANNKADLRTAAISLQDTFLCKEFNLTPLNSGFTLKSVMGIQEIIGRQKEQIFAIAAKYGASHIRIFGSVARGEADETSDIDFLVDLEPGRSLFDLGGLLMDLQALLNRKVDVVTEKGLHWYIKDRILKEAKPL
jgi:predicted nucleotidyltransferase